MRKTAIIGCLFALIFLWTGCWSETAADRARRRAQEKDGEQEAAAGEIASVSDSVSFQEVKPVSSPALRFFSLQGPVSAVSYTIDDSADGDGLHYDPITEFPIIDGMSLRFNREGGFENLRDYLRRNVDETGSVDYMLNSEGSLRRIVINNYAYNSMDNTYSYNSDGLPVSFSNSGIHESTKGYISYNAQNLPVRLTFEAQFAFMGEEGTLKGTVTADYLSFDSHGNWTRRRLDIRAMRTSSVYDQNGDLQPATSEPDNNSFIESRTISYY